MKTYRDRIATNLPNIGVEAEIGPEGVVAVYIRLSLAPVYETVEMEESETLCDIDCEGRPVGIEMINPGHVSFKKVLKAIYARFKVRPQLDAQTVKRFEALIAG